MFNNKNLLVFILVTIIVCVFLTCGLYSLLTGRFLGFTDEFGINPVDIVSIAQSRVEIGEDRDSALVKFSDAWFHSECKWNSSDLIRDLFFFGPQDPDKVKIVLIRSREINKNYVVESVGSLENYMLHLYEHCTPVPSSAFESP